MYNVLIFDISKIKAVKIMTYPAKIAFLRSKVWLENRGEVFLHG